MTRARAALGIALGLGVSTCALPAGAYCLTHGCNPQTQECLPDQRGCVTEGPLLQWKSGCVSFDVQQDGSPRRGIAYDTAHAAVVQGFEQWLRADCGKGKHPSISISDYGPVACHEAEYNQDSPNANIIMFRDSDWPYENAIDTLALTTLIFDADSGAIYDADVEINTFQSDMTTGRVGPLDVDLHSVVTHELGHFLGLSHTEVALSTMDSSYSPGRTDMATIEYDDEQGVCAALPPSREVESNSCDPRHGFSRECALEATTCAFGYGPRGGRASSLVLLLGLSSMLLRKRLRRAGQRP